MLNYKKENAFRSKFNNFTHQYIIQEPNFLKMFLTHLHR